MSGYTRREQVIALANTAMAMDSGRTADKDPEAAALMLQAAELVGLVLQDIKDIADALSDLADVYTEGRKG